MPPVYDRGDGPGSPNFTGRRWHELALQQWFHSRFFVRAGYPVPIIFAAPMDAFGQFEKLWKSDKNPFDYLLEVKGDDGKPIYTHPSNQVYPLISISPKGWSFRPQQNFSVRRWRRVNWPSVADDVARKDLGTVTQSMMPAAWNFKFQVDHFCLRPDTQAHYIHQAMINLTRGGGNPQTWLPVIYPNWWGPRWVRMYLDGDIQNMTADEPAEGAHTEYRTSFNLVIEGYVPDYYYSEVPAMWKLVFNSSYTPSPGELEAVFSEVFDLRSVHGNDVFARRTATLPVT